MSKVKINVPGWEFFCGKLSRIEFNNGVSVRELTPIEKRRLGANIQIVDVDTGTQVGSATEVGKYNDIGARQLENLPRGVDEPVSVEAPVSATVETPEKTETAEPEKEAKKVWTREELEAIADKSGIKGVRQVAVEFGVKGVQISELIEEILTAQAK